MSVNTAYREKHLRLKMLLMRRGLSQRALAIRLGVSVSTLNDALRGRRPARLLRQRLIHEYDIPSVLLERKAA